MSLDEIREQLKGIEAVQARTDKTLEELTGTLSQFSSQLEENVISHEKFAGISKNLASSMIDFNQRLKRLESFIYEGGAQTERPPPPEVQ